MPAPKGQVPHFEALAEAPATSAPYFDVPQDHKIAVAVVAKVCAHFNKNFDKKRFTDAANGG